MMEQKKRKTSKSVGVAVGNTASAQNYSDNVVMRANRGHGFAAEKANDLYDKVTGKNAKIIGGDNAKDGADRLVNGVQIQTKYCATGSKCVNDCFDTKGKFRYWNQDGTPMQIEVPSDKYDVALKALAKKITAGQLKGVRDPKQASEIVRKGNFTYDQAKLIAKAGNIQSLTYDGVKGVELAGSAMGISAAIAFAMAVWNGEKLEVAIESACAAGLNVGGIAWVTSVLTAQMGRTSLEQSLRATTDWAVKQMGAKATNLLANNGLREGGKALRGAAAKNSVSKSLGGGTIAIAVTTAVLSSVDILRMIDGKISGAQLIKNVTTTGAGVAGGWAGAQSGAAAGTALWPGPGTVIGFLLGSLLGGSASQAIAQTVMDGLIEDDANEMLSILESVVLEQAQLYMLNKTQLEALIGAIQSTADDLSAILIAMYAEKDRTAYARGLIAPAVKSMANMRKKVRLPSDAQMLKGVGKLVNKAAKAR